MLSHIIKYVVLKWPIIVYYNIIVNDLWSHIEWFIAAKYSFTKCLTFNAEKCNNTYQWYADKRGLGYFKKMHGPKYINFV